MPRPSWSSVLGGLVPLESLKAMLEICPRKTFTGCRDRAILLALLDTGCRVSEFLSLNVGDVDLA